MERLAPTEKVESASAPLAVLERSHILWGTTFCSLDGATQFLAIGPTRQLTKEFEAVVSTCPKADTLTRSYKRTLLYWRVAAMAGNLALPLVGARAFMGFVAHGHRSILFTIPETFWIALLFIGLYAWGTVCLLERDRKQCFRRIVEVYNQSLGAPRDDAA